MKRYYIFLLLVWLAGCKERYDPPPIATTTNYLVVEGLINSGAGATLFQLSRTVKLADSVVQKPELNAQVVVEGEDQSRYPLISTGNGQYMADQLNLDPAVSYRLHITTGNQQEYISDYVPVNETPPVDSISWKAESGGVRIFANTHDPQNNTRYYKWDFEETWEIRSPYPADFSYVNGDVILDYNQKTKICWRYGHSNNINIGSSAKLQSDVIHEAPLQFIAQNDEKLSYRYSLLLRQYAIDKSAYTFYEIMKKNTESLGSIFDAQPSELRGNIHSVTNPEEPVIGYVSVSNVTEKRLFIRNSELADWRYSMQCETKLIPNNTDSFRYFYPYQYLPYSAKATGPIIEGYYSAQPECVDCTLRGSNIKPSYW